MAGGIKGHIQLNKFAGLFDFLKLQTLFNSFNCYKRMT